MGTGNFYSVLPEQYQGTKLYGVELDSITGRIAKQLYPEADISVMGYEAVKFEDNSFDVILGNIPFNSVKIYDRRYNELNPYIHDYFSLSLWTLPSRAASSPLSPARAYWIGRTRACGNISHGGQSSLAPSACPIRRSKCWREPK